MKEITVIFPLGAPGSGKGEIGRALADKLGAAHVSTRKVLQESRDPVVRKIMDEGGVVPDHIMIPLWECALRKAARESSLIYPDSVRSAKQVEWMVQLEELCHARLITFHFTVDPELLVKRLAKRREEEGREDDELRVIWRRMYEYQMYFPGTHRALDTWTTIEQIDANQELEHVLAGALHACSRHGVVAADVSSSAPSILSPSFAG